jgi:hypothetical protein
MRLRARPWLSAGRIVLLPPAAFAVHQLRYELAYGSAAGEELRETGHSYLHSAVPWLVALLALAAGGFLLVAGRAFARRVAPRTRTVSFAGLWALSVVALLAIFAGQETLEGLFATGHPGGWAAVFGDGGWWAVPVAGCVGLVLATIFHTARWAVRRIVALRGPAVPAAHPRRSPAPRPRDVAVRAPAPLLAGWSSRGPPAEVCVPAA